MSVIDIKDMTVEPIAKDEFSIAFDRQITDGLAEYLTMLKAFNGRNAWEDLLAEQVDGLMYATQLMMEMSVFIQVALALRAAGDRLAKDPDSSIDRAVLDGYRRLSVELDTCIERSGFITSIASLRRNATKTTSQG